MGGNQSPASHKWLAMRTGLATICGSARALPQRRTCGHWCSRAAVRPNSAGKSGAASCGSVATTTAAAVKCSCPTVVTRHPESPCGVSVITGDAICTTCPNRPIRRASATANHSLAASATCHACLCGAEKRMMARSSGARRGQVRVVTDSPHHWAANCVSAALSGAGGVAIRNQASSGVSGWRRPHARNRQSQKRGWGTGVPSILGQPVAGIDHCCVPASSPQVNGSERSGCRESTPVRMSCFNVGAAAGKRSAFSVSSASAPPSCARFSSTITEYPQRANRQPAVSPAAPAPITTIRFTALLFEG